MANDPYTQGLKNQFGSMMQAFPDLTIKEVDAIVSYVNQTVAAKISQNQGKYHGKLQSHPITTLSSSVLSLLFLPSLH